MYKKGKRKDKKKNEISHSFFCCLFCSQMKIPLNLSIFYKNECEVFKMFYAAKINCRCA